MLFDKNRLSGYFNLENYKLKNKYNIIYNNKMNFYIKKSNGWLLNKKNTRLLLIQNMTRFLREFSLKSSAMLWDISFHSYKIKNNQKKINNSYLLFFDFIIIILKNINPELYKRLQERNYIDKLKQEIRDIYQRIEEKDYYTAISYGPLKAEYNMIKDHYYLSLLKDTDWELLNELLLRFDSTLDWITDWLESLFWIEWNTELNNLQFLYNFFSEDIWYMEKNSDIIKLLDVISNDNDLIVEFNNYISEYEKYTSTSKWKYKNKILYQLFLIYQKTKEKYFSNDISYDSLIPIKIKEWDVYKINEYFYKTLYVLPIKNNNSSLELWINIQKIEDVLDNININFWYIVNQTIKPYNNIDYEMLFETENITDHETKKNIIDTWLYHTTYMITLKTVDYSTFSSIEKKIKELEISDNLRIIENKDISNLFPFYRQRSYSYTTSWIDLFPPQYVDDNGEDIFTNFFPKKINYEKGAIIWYNKETLSPVFFNAWDERICLNKHMVVLWKSWSWKTYWTKILVKNALMFNKFIIVDHLWNYNDIKDNFIEKHWWKIISLDSNTLVNPLIFNTEVGTSIETHLEYLMTIFSWEEGKKTLTTWEERLLLLILSSLYKNPYRKIENNTIYVNIDEMIKRTIEFSENYKKTKDAENGIIANSLVQYLKSLKTWLLWNYLMSDKQLNILEILKKENLVLFDFKELRESGSKVAMTIFSFLVFQSIHKYIFDSFDERQDIINNIINKWEITKEWFKKDVNTQWSLPVYLIVDEIHSYLQNNSIGEQIKSIVKEARNKSWWLISITQEISDFLKNPYWKSIFTQSSSYLIYNKDISDEDFQLIKKTLLSKDDPLWLDDTDIDFLQDANSRRWSALFLHGWLPSQKIQTLTDPDFIR